MDQRIAIVTGANRCRELETSRQLAQRGFHVIVTGRRIRKVETAIKGLHAAG